MAVVDGGVDWGEEGEGWEDRIRRAREISMVKGGCMVAIVVLMHANKH